MAKPFISMDIKRFNLDLKKVMSRNRAWGRLSAGAAGTALLRYAEHVMGEAQRRAPIGTGHGNKFGVASPNPGRLRESMTVVGPFRTGGSVEVFGSFNVPYSRIQDEGGTITPKTGRFLFIPLRAGVRSGDPNAVRNVDFILAKKVTIPGTGYLTKTVREMAPQASAFVGRQFRALAMPTGGGGPGRDPLTGQFTGKA